MYPYRFTNIHMFVQRVADNIVKYGYVKYVTGTIPAGKDPAEVDAKILAKYGIDVSRWVRARRKKSGKASVHYVRHQNLFAMFVSPWASTCGGRKRRGVNGAVGKRRRGGLLLKWFVMRRQAQGCIRVRSSAASDVYKRQIKHSLLLPATREP